MPADSGVTRLRWRAERCRGGRPAVRCKLYRGHSSLAWKADTTAFSKALFKAPENVNMKKVSVEMHGSKNVILDFKISDRIKCGQGKSPPIPCPASLTPAATCEGNHFFMDISSDMAKLPLNGGGKSLTSTIIYGNG